MNAPFTAQALMGETHRNIQEMMNTSLAPKEGIQLLQYGAMMHVAVQLADLIAFLKDKANE